MSASPTALRFDGPDDAGSPNAPGIVCGAKAKPPVLLHFPPALLLLPSTHVTWKVEYLYMDLGTRNYTFNDPAS
jgi:hypothetical protein